MVVSKAHNNGIIPCSVTHKHNCVVFSVKEGFLCSLQYKKFLMTIFVVQTLFTLRKIKSPAVFLKSYVRFFARPMLFMGLFTGFTRLLICMVRKLKIRSFWKISFLLLFLPLSGLVESEKRLRDLSVYFSVEALQAFVYSYKAYMGITDKNFDKNLNVT